MEARARQPQHAPHLYCWALTNIQLTPWSFHQIAKSRAQSAQAQRHFRERRRQRDIFQQRLALQMEHLDVCRLELIIAHINWQEIL